MRCDGTVLPGGVMGLQGRGRAKVRPSWSGFRLQSHLVLPWQMGRAWGTSSPWLVSSALVGFVFGR